MCLVIVAWRQHSKFPLIVAGNRDEFHARPTRDAHWWPDHPDIVGGRDLQAAGTWLALHRDGRFATVTNYRDAAPPSPKKRSRGHLVTDFLLGSVEPLAYLNSIDGSAYAGFNLLLSDGETLAWHSNRGNSDDSARILPPGVYGLSNALLDSPWPKVERSKATMKRLLDEDKVNETELLRLLDDRDKAPTSAIVSDGLPFEKAHAISAPFIVLPDYGTRSSSAVLQDANGEWRFHERRFNADGRTSGDSSFVF
jgi:uncharacterized protein with NRDE domain